jgi:hypothetical protein
MNKYSWLTFSGSSSASYRACAKVISFIANDEKHIHLSLEWASVKLPMDWQKESNKNLFIVNFMNMHFQCRMLKQYKNQK